MSVAGEIRSLAEVMAQFHLRRLKEHDFDLEMDPSGFVARDAEVGEPEEDKLDVCTCGHVIVTDHNEHGCLHGCSIEVCAPQGSDGR